MPITGIAVLCIDDDIDTCELIQFACPEAGFTFAHSFRAGLDIMRRGVFDLYILDNWLPDGSGIELCSEIRRTDPNTPVIFFSAAAYGRDHDQALAAGATAYLDKPSGIFTLQILLGELLRQSEARSLDAKLAEVAAIREEVQDYLARIGPIQGSNIERHEKRIDLLRTQAYGTFTASGGVRSQFERLWSDVLSDLTSSRRM